MFSSNDDVVESSATTKKQVTGGIEAPDFSEFIESTPLWSEVLPGLWIGGTDDCDVLGDVVAFSGKAAFIKPEHFDSVVTMYQYANPVDWLVKEYRYCIYDSDVSHFDLKSLFDVVRFAHDEWIAGKRVLIRCQAGLNRSGLVTALVLVRSGYSPQDAIELIRKRRNSLALFNRQFVKFLMSLDAEKWRRSNWHSSSANAS